MTRRTLFAALLVSTILVAGPEAFAAEKIESSPTDDRVVVDGDPSDWEGVSLSYLEDSLHVFAIAHDETNLYLMYRFADEVLARRLLMRGVTLWFNGDGKTKKKKEEFAVRYSGSEQIAEQFEDQDSRLDRYRATTEGAEPSDPGRPPPSLASMRQVPGELTLIRMGMKEMIPEKESGGPMAASTFHEGIFCYELKIPFADIGGKIAVADPGKRRRVAIGVQIGGMTQAETETLQAAMREKMGRTGGQGGTGGGSMGGGPPGGMGGGGLGGMGGGMGSTGGMGGGGMGGGRGKEMRDRMDPEIKWLTVSLP